MFRNRNHRDAEQVTRFADDPTNRDVGFMRPRLRALMPALAAEGGDARNLARLAQRLARANAAVEVLADGAERYLALLDRTASGAGPGAKSLDAKPLDAKTFDATAFAAMPEEIRLRLLKRAIDRFGHEAGGARQVEALLQPGPGAGEKARKPPAEARSGSESANDSANDSTRAEADPRRGAGEPDRRPDSRRAGAAASPPAGIAAGSES
jgi:hypothetical protein